MPSYRDEDTLRELYWDEGMSIQEIADHCGCHRTTAHDWMKKHGIERRTAPQNKPVQHRITESGYECWRHDTGGTQYKVLVHRLQKVAEEGIDAVKGMEVHHKNRIPWDNRPSNLELVTSEEHWDITTDQIRVDAADISDEKLREYIYEKSMSINDIVEEEGCKKLAVERCLEQSPVWRRFFPERDNQIVVCVVENNSIEFATDYFDLAETTIEQRLRAAERNDLISNGRVPLQDRYDKDELQRLYHEGGCTQKEIAERYDTTAGRISQVFSRLDISTRGRGPEPGCHQTVDVVTVDREYPWRDEDLLYSEYVEKGHGYVTLAREWDTNRGTIRRWVEKFGFEKNDPTDYTDEPWHDEDTLREMYHDQQMTQQEIADELGCSSTTIKKWLDRHDIETGTRHKTPKMK